MLIALRGTDMFTLFFSVLASTILFSTKPAIAQTTPNIVLSVEKYSLADRYAEPSVNRVFTDNILLTLSYMDKMVKQGEQISWDQVRSDRMYTLTLKPGETFAFHDSVLSQYQNKIAATTNAHFNANEGFESDGWLVGDGVCHLASFMNVAARAAGLTVVALTKHDFAAIPEVSKENGVAIYDSPNDPVSSSLQNLYITNNKDKDIAFVFTHKHDSLDIQVEELNK